MLNWKLIFRLSLFGLFMGLTTVTLISSNVEPIFWFAIFIYCAYLIAKNCSSNYFLHGFLVSMANSLWITATHVIFYSSYMASHPEMTAMPVHGHPRLMILGMGPIFGAAFGLVLGLFAYIASKAFTFRKVYENDQ